MADIATETERAALGDLRPIPDPTERTTEAVNLATQIARDYTDGEIKVLMERLDGIDRATRLLNETVNRVPTDMQTAILNLREIQNERFSSIGQQFSERDTRSERESRDNKLAVDAAFAAQEKQAAAMQKANSEAIGKSENATAETIQKLAELVETNIAGLVSTIGDIKERVNRIESRGLGRAEVATEHQITFSQIATLAAITVAALGVIATIVVNSLP